MAREDLVAVSRWIEAFEATTPAGCPEQSRVSNMHFSVRIPHG
jgi:hypothetical protein